MQFVVKRDILLKSLNFVQGVVEKKNTLPILSNVLIQLKNKKLSIIDDLLQEKGKIFSLLGDGECYEGSVWEAAITATENNLGNLFAVIDVNGFQNDGKIGKNMDLKNLSNKWRGFGWNTIVCDGHNISNILKIDITQQYKNVNRWKSDLENRPSNPVLDNV